MGRGCPLGVFYSRGEVGDRFVLMSLGVLSNYFCPHMRLAQTFSMRVLGASPCKIASVILLGCEACESMSLSERVLLE